MAFSYEDYAYDQYMADLGHEEELQNAIEAISIENASWCLGTFGDALEKRVRGLIDEAKVLAQFGPWASQSTCEKAPIKLADVSLA